MADEIEFTTAPIVTDVDPLADLFGGQFSGTVDAFNRANARSILRGAGVTRNLVVDYNGSLATLAAETSPVTVEIKTTVTHGSDVTIPDNVLVDIQKGGKIIADNCTVTIENLGDHPNGQIFDWIGTGKIKLTNVEEHNLSHFVADENAATAAINMVLDSIDANGGGAMYIPDELYLTEGGHLTRTNLTVRGDGRLAGMLRLTQDGFVFKNGPGTNAVIVKDCQIYADFDNNTTQADGILCEGAYGEATANGLIVKNVNFYVCNRGLAINSSSGGSWQQAGVYVDPSTRFTACNEAVYINSINSVVEIDAYIQCNEGASYGQKAIVTGPLGSGQLTIGGEWAGLSSYNGRGQVTRLTIAISGSTTPGIGQLAFTVNGVTRNVYFDAYATTAVNMAFVALNACEGDPWVSSKFHFSRSGASIDFIGLDSAANDASRSVSTSNLSGNILTASSSTEIQAGIAQNKPITGLEINGPHGAIAFKDGFVDEGFVDVIRNNYSDPDGTIIVRGNIQGNINLAQTCSLFVSAGWVVDKCIRDSAASYSLVVIDESVRVRSISAVGLGFTFIEGAAPSTITGIGGNSILANNVRHYLQRKSGQYQDVAYFNDGQLAQHGTFQAPRMSLTTVNHDGRPQNVWGHCNEQGEFQTGYGSLRDHTDARCKFVGSQTGTPGVDTGYDFDADITAPELTVGGGTLISQARHGTAVLVAGVKAVTDTTVTANTRIFVQRQTDGGTIGASYSVTRTAGTSFTITSKDSTGATQTADTSTLAYWTVEP